MKKQFLNGDRVRWQKKETITYEGEVIKVGKKVMVRFDCFKGEEIRPFTRSVNPDNLTLVFRPDRVFYEVDEKRNIMTLGTK